MDDDSYITKITRRSLILFFVLAYGITWGLSFIATERLLPIVVPPLLLTISAILLHYGPALAAILIVAATGGRQALGGLFGKLGHWRVGWRWYAFVLFFPLLVHLAAVGVDVLLGGRWPGFFSAAEVPDGNPILLIPAVFLVVFFQAGLAEEIGWRGYGLPGLQQRYGPVAASIFLGIIWWFWHFHPMNFDSLWPTAGWYLYNTLSFTFLLTWVYNNTNGSILLAALFHTASNVCDWIVPTFSVVADSSGIRPFIIQGTINWIVVIGLAILYKEKYFPSQGVKSK
jgi:uncharacterized protein